MYKRDLEIENPKKFQRHLNDTASNVLLKRGYYLSKNNSKFPFLKANGIANIADFNGLLCFVKDHRNYNNIIRIFGIIIITLSLSHFIHSLMITSHDLLLMNMPTILGVGLGIFLIIHKFGKDICIEIRLVGESYRTDFKKEKESIEYLNVRSNARLTVEVSTLDHKKSLNEMDLVTLNGDGNLLIEVLSPFLENFLEK